MACRVVDRRAASAWDRRPMGNSRRRWKVPLALRRDSPPPGWWWWCDSTTTTVRAARLADDGQVSWCAVAAAAAARATAPATPARLPVAVELLHVDSLLVD